MRPLACWDCEFESRRGHGGLSVVSVVCCQVKVSATSWSLVQRSHTYCGASLFVIEKPQEWGGHGPRWDAAPQKEEEKFNNLSNTSNLLRGLREKLAKICSGVELCDMGYSVRQVSGLIFSAVWHHIAWYTGTSTSAELSAFISQFVLPWTWIFFISQSKQRHTQKTLISK